MNLYAIGDLHLSLSDPDKSMDVFGGCWGNYIEKIEAGFSALTDDDVCVICGDISWAMNLEKAVEDFRFLNALPGRKLLIKGNHDFWWATTAKVNDFFRENRFDTLQIVFNSCAELGTAAVCGTRGWFYEQDRGTEQDRKIMLREVGRLDASLRAAGELEKLCFLHYPPRYGTSYVCQEIVQTMQSHGVRRCWYGHLHGYGRKQAVVGPVGGIEYTLISADALDFTPLRIEFGPDKGTE